MLLSGKISVSLIIFVTDCECRTVPNKVTGKPTKYVPFISFTIFLIRF